MGDHVFAHRHLVLKTGCVDSGKKYPPQGKDGLEEETEESKVNLEGSLS